MVCREGGSQIAVWAKATGRRVVVHSQGDSPKGSGQGKETHILYSNYRKWGN